MKGFTRDGMRTFWLQHFANGWFVFDTKSREPYAEREATPYEIAFWLELTRDEVPCPHCGCSGGWLYLKRTPRGLLPLGFWICRCCDEAVTPGSGWKAGTVLRVGRGMHVPSVRAFLEAARGDLA